MSDSKAELLIHDVEEVDNFKKTKNSYGQSLEEIEELLNDILLIPERWNIKTKWPINLMVTGLNHLKELIIGLYQFY